MQGKKIEHKPEMKRTGSLQGKSRGPFDGFLEAFDRPPTSAGFRERKPPKIQRLLRRAMHHKTRLRRTRTRASETTTGLQVNK